MDRGRARGAERHPRVGDAPALQPERGGDGDYRKVPRPALDLLVGAAAPRPHREPDLGEDLAVLDRSHVGANVEVIHRNHALAVRADDHDARLQRRADRGQVLGGIGLGQRAADRPAVSHRRIGDHLLRVDEERELPGEELGLEQLTVARHGPDPDLSLHLPDVGELVEVVDVDQALGIGEPQLHHRQQAVAAGQDAGLGPVFLQELDRVLDARRPLVLDRPGCLHLQDPPPSTHPSDGLASSDAGPPSAPASVPITGDLGRCFGPPGSSATGPLGFV